MTPAKALFDTGLCVNLVIDYPNRMFYVTEKLVAESARSGNAWLQQALANLMRGRTTVVIAHRLTTIHRADKIVVLNRGQVVDTGSHGELMSRGGIYRELYELQFSDEMIAEGEGRLVGS